MEAKTFDKSQNASTSLVVAPSNLGSVTYHMSQIYKHDSTGTRVIERPHSNCTDATRDTTTQSISALVARQAHLQLARLLLR
jgi:hypothetical protein